MSITHPSGTLPALASRRVPFLELRIDDEQERHRLLEAIEKVLTHGRLVLGPEVDHFERRLADRCGRRFGVAVNSGSTALWLGLRAVGIGPGDEVITTPLSWVATANAIALTGATPVFADIGDDLNLDPETIEALITPRTRAIVPVHFTGRPCNMDAMTAIAERYGLLIVEDAAQAFDATWRGRRVGSFGAVGCFSMNAMKVFAACGDAGGVVTDREDVYQSLVRLRYNGTVNREVCVEKALNGRIDPLQAAILLQRLDDLPMRIQKRRQVSTWYTERLAGLVEVPPMRANEEHVWYTYQIRTSRRDELMTFLDARGIQSRIQHPYLIPEQPPYRACVGQCPNARRLVKQILCLPVTERVTLDDVEYVVAAIREFHGCAG
jgi:dTDP-4-amino-4,6-dideoxygalactose transaminase